MTSLEAAAEAFIEESVQLARVSAGDSATSFRVLREHDFGERNGIHKLALAYAFTVRFGDNEALIAVARGRPIRRGEKVDAARIFVQALTPSAGLTKERARSRYSRDTRAIRYLRTLAISPQSVVERGRTKGEGAHAWAGRYATSMSKKKKNASRTAELALPVYAMVTFNFENKERFWVLEGIEKIKQVQNLLSKWPEKKMVVR